MSDHSTYAVILAAGLSTRMGRTKQLLEIKERPLLELVMGKVAAVQFEQILVVVGHEADLIQEQISLPDSRFKWVVNSSYQLGQHTSFLKGIQLVPSESSVMFFLADQPFIEDKMIRNILEKGCQIAKERKTAIAVRPYYENQPGHPVFLAHFQELRLVEEGSEAGGKSLIKQAEMFRLEVDESSVLFDIDTPDDYEDALRAERDMGKRVF